MWYRAMCEGTVLIIALRSLQITSKDKAYLYRDFVWVGASNTSIEASVDRI